jgi:hypothetical protein
MDESELRKLEQDAEERRVLLAAADLLEKGGHCKHALRNGTAHCVFGAMIVAAGGEVTEDGSVVKLPVFSHKLLTLQVGWILDWNNAPERTAEEVISTLRLVASS